MKKKSKISFKKVVYFIISTLISSLVFVGSTVFFCDSSYDKLVQIQKESNFIDDGLIDYTVYGLSNEQKIEYTKLDYVDSVVSYTEYGGRLFVNDVEHKNITIVVMEDFNNLQKTPYKDSRLVEKSSKQYDSSILVGYTYAKNNNVKLDDKITIPYRSGNITGNVSAIYEDNYINGTSAFAVSYAENKDLISTLNPKFKFQHSFVTVSDSKKFETYLRENYKPLGTLLTREDFDNAFDYEIYLTEFNSKDYFNSSNVKKFVIKNQFNIKEVKAAVNKNVIMFTGIASIVMLIVLLLCGFLYSRNLKSISHFTGDVKKYSKPNLVSTIILLLVVISSSFVTPYVFINSEALYVKYDLFIKYISPLLISGLLVVVVTAFLNQYFIKKVFHKKLAIMAATKAQEEKAEKVTEEDSKVK